MLYSMVTTIGLSIVAKPSPNLMRLMSAILAPFVDQEFIMLMARMRKDDLATLAQLMEAGEMRPVIDRTWRPGGRSDPLLGIRARPGENRH
jgi:hypothetical protein